MYMVVQKVYTIYILNPLPGTLIFSQSENKVYQYPRLLAGFGDAVYWLFPSLLDILE